jgi:hypothetical protein
MRTNKIMKRAFKNSCNNYKGLVNITKEQLLNKILRIKDDNTK